MGNHQCILYAFVSQWKKDGSTGIEWLALTFFELFYGSGGRVPPPGHEKSSQNRGRPRPALPTVYQDRS